MVTVMRMHLPSNIPIVGCELLPYVLLQLPNKTVSSDDIPESSPVEGHFLRYKWYRIEGDKKVKMCSIHPSKQATVQCLRCAKTNIPTAKSYHCCTKCFVDAWPHHRDIHGLQGTATPSHLVSRKIGDETWFEVSYSKTYIPTADDIDHALRFECFVIDVETKIAAGFPNTIQTSPVIPAPSPTPRRLIPISSLDGSGNTDIQGRVSSEGTFTVLSYNVLSDSNASRELYSYCPSWALSWSYRRLNLLREIVGYRADIVCLQEVQSNHFEEFFRPELDKHGYEALYKRRTSEVPDWSIVTIDGCATFFRRDRFSYFTKYEVEFNKAAQSIIDAVVPDAERKTALDRLVKDNVALIAVLEPKFGNHGVDAQGRKQLVCVANAHVNVDEDLKDVKLWQVLTLLKGLEQLTDGVNVPILLCGDLSSVPGSAPHTLLAFGDVGPLHPDLTVDPVGILRAHTKLSHAIPLVSAYSSFARIGESLGHDQQKGRVDPATKEPLFTYCTRDFTGTLDYIFFSADGTLTVELVLELPDKDGLKKDTALPSPEWPSDHIALLAGFRYRPPTTTTAAAAAAATGPSSSNHASSDVDVGKDTKELRETTGQKD